MTTARFGRTNRRRFVATSAFGGAAVLTMGQPLRAAPSTKQPAAVLAQDSTSSDVPMFRGNAARTGEMPGPGPDDSNGVEFIWQFHTVGGFSSSPAIVADIVYAGSEDSNLYALNADDGTERWRFAAGESLSYSSPAVVDGVVYIGSNDGTLYAVNADDGTERWRHSIGDRPVSPPVVVGGVVYVGSSDPSWQSEVALYAIGGRLPRLSVGGTARVTERTNLRGGPAPTTVERAGLIPDTVVTITGEAETSGDAVWWPVTVDATGDQGWVEASTLEPLTSGPEPTATA